MHIDTDSCNCIVTDPDMALSDKSGWDLTIAPGDGSGHSQEAPPLHLEVISSISLHHAQAAPLLFLSNLFTHCGCPQCRLALNLTAPGWHPPAIRCLQPSCALWICSLLSSLQISVSLLPPMLHHVVVGTALSVYEPPILWGRGQVSGYLSLATSCGMEECRSVFLFLCRAALDLI